MKNSMHDYLRPRSTLVLPMLAFAVMATAAAVWACLNTVAQREKLVLLEERNLQLSRSLKVVPVSKPRAADVERQKRWDDLRKERAFSWASVFDALERADNKEIELLEFQPDKVNGSLILRGEALSNQALAAYLSTLAQQRGFSRAHLTSTESRTKDKLTTVSFTLKVSLARE